MHFKRHALLALALLNEAAFAAPSLIVVNANIFTADPGRPRAEALAIEDGLFSAVGGNAEVRALAAPDSRGRRGIASLVQALSGAIAFIGTSLPAVAIAHHA